MSPTFGSLGDFVVCVTGPCWRGPDRGQREFQMVGSTLYQWVAQMALVIKLSAGLSINECIFSTYYVLNIVRIHRKYKTSFLCRLNLWSTYEIEENERTDNKIQLLFPFWWSCATSNMGKMMHVFIKICLKNLSLICGTSHNYREAIKIWSKMTSIDEEG